MAVNEQTRKEVIRRLLEDLPPEHETLRVPWQGEQARLPVIRLNLNSTVLNWRSHRIKSQLESQVAVAEAVLLDPDGDVAQEAIAQLLRTVVGFDALKQNIADEGQREPGIIDCNGRLVNANTRAVALKDLGQEYIDVAVLPSTATIGEIYDVELDLQVAEDYRQPYSFTNELLFVDDLLTEQNRNEEEVGVRLRWITPTKRASVKEGIAKVRRYVRHLDLLRSIQQMSGGKIPLTQFDDALESLLEFDKSYETLLDSDPIAAQRMKHARTLGLLVELGYMSQRSVDAEWVESYLADAFSEDDLLTQIIAGETLIRDDEEDTSSSLSDFEDFDRLDEEDSYEGEAVFGVVGLLVNRLSESAGDANIRLPTVEGEKEFDRESVRAAIFEAMRTAAEDAKSTKKAGSELKAPLYLVEQAAKQLTRARTQLLKVSTHPDFDAATLRDGLEVVTRASDALRMELED